jgi:23S rRNA (adenine2030-N6)-methyltransferase
MLAYRHAFHAGNHADVLKHAVLVAVLRHMNAKDKAWRLVDTHAGAGLYGLHTDYARKLAEHEQGVARLLGSADLPPMLDDYLQQVMAFNPDDSLRIYPGSPQLARLLMRPQDQRRLDEVHPTDHALLAQTFEGDRQVTVYRGDGFGGIKAQLPPPSRRGVLLIDPSYEIRTDYAAVTAAVREALTRFAECVIIVWYPHLDSRDSAQLAQRLKPIAQSQASRGWLHTRMTVAEPNDRGFGLLGSGLFVINPPYTLAALLKTCLPVLTQRLGQCASPSFVLEQFDNA